MMLCAGNLVTNGDAGKAMESWSEEQVQVVSEAPHSGGHCFKTIAPLAVSAQIIQIDPSGTYRVSAWIRSVDDRTPDVYLGLIPLDANRNRIMPETINIVKNTETELAADCSAADMVVKVKNAENFQARDRFNLIAFQTRADYSDLPNKNLSQGTLRRIEKKNGYWELTLDKPCGRNFPAGTPVRQHRFSANYLYPASSGKFNSKDWVKITGTVQGSALFGAGGYKFWPGMKYVQIAILSLHGGMILFDDLQFEKVK